ncbi:hypothetical protein IJJ36_04405 [Candidatus Saccharibacteria bacterium]|nr:hypothetical protein [Candidatus Saccharibacteria bacterium]
MVVEPSMLPVETNCWLPPLYKDGNLFLPESDYKQKTTFSIHNYFLSISVSKIGGSLF